jgi:hypothetical protein
LLLIAAFALVGLIGCAQKVRFAPYGKSADGLIITRTDALTDAGGKLDDRSMRVDAPLRVAVDGNARTVTLGVQRARCVLGIGQSARIVDSDDATTRARGLGAGHWVPLADESFRLRFNGIGQVIEVRAYPVVEKALAAYAALAPQEMSVDAIGRRIARTLYQALFEEPLSYLPDGPARVGQSWERMVTFRTTLRLCNMDVRGVRVVRCRLVRIDESDGGRVAVIDVEGVSRTQSRRRSAEPAWRTRGTLRYDLEADRPRRLVLTMEAAVGESADNRRAIVTTLEVTAGSR